MKRKRADVIAVFRPRIRLWRAGDGEWHIAGEPDGFRTVLLAFRSVASRARDRAIVDLQPEPPPDERNPVASLGVGRAYAHLELMFDRGVTQAPRISEEGERVRVTFSSDCKYELGYGLYEAIEGAGDFAISVIDDAGGSFLWFWGYATAHGTNTF